MLEISDYIVNLIEGDATLQTLMGSDADDSRVYPFDVQYEVPWSDTYKAALFWRNNSNPVPVHFSYPSQIGNIYFYFQIVSPDKSLCKQIEERLMTLLCPNTNAGFSTTNYRVGYIFYNGSGEGTNEGTPNYPLFSRILSILCQGVFTRP